MSSSEQLLPENARKRRRLLNDFRDDESQRLGILHDRLQNLNQDASKLNFDEAIRMATNNKINTTNTWDFALIDYFHDMKLLRGQDGTSINFQKAGATLDGCMKIFSHRIDSVVSDTGILLSGLSQRNNTSNESTFENNSLMEEDDTVNDKKKNKTRKLSITLQEDFSALKIKRFDQALKIDPLFKRAIAEFDEGGARSLLMNVLKINANGLIVFDETISKSIVSTSSLNHIDETQHEVEVTSSDTLKNVKKYFAKYDFDSLSEIKSATLCPSMGSLVSVLKNTDNVNTFVDSVLQTDETIKNVTVDLDLNDPTGIEQIRESVSDDNNEDRLTTDKLPSAGSEESIENGYEVEKIDEEVLSMLDSKKLSNINSWKVSLFKRNMGGKLRKELVKSESNKKSDSTLNGDSGVVMISASKMGNHHAVIDFMSDYSTKEEKALFRKGKKLTLPSSKFDNKKNVTLPDDLRWNSRRLVSLFEKPQSRIHLFKKKLLNSSNDLAFSDAEVVEDDNIVDDPGMDLTVSNAANEQEAIDYETQGTFGDIDFNMQFASQDNSNSSDLNYARVPKKVDIRFLKDNMWQSTLELKKKDFSVLKLSDVVKGTLNKYKSKQKSDLSTSFFFICMLHLANEHGLELDDNEAHTDLTIRADEEAAQAS